MRVIASAGTGKTSFIIDSVVNLLRAKVPVSAMLVIMFNKQAQLDFQHRIKSLRESKCSFTGVSTIHALANYIMKGVPRRGTGRSDTMFVQLLIKSAFEVIQTRGLEVKQLSKFRDLRIIFVDEAQDLNSSEI